MFKVFLILLVSLFSSIVFAVEICSKEVAVAELKKVCNNFSSLSIENILDNKSLYKNLVFKNCGLSQITLVEQNSPYKILASIFNSADRIKFYDTITDDVRSVAENLFIKKNGSVNEFNYGAYINTINVRKEKLAMLCKSKNGQVFWAETGLTYYSNRMASDLVLDIDSDFISSEANSAFIKNFDTTNGDEKRTIATRFSDELIQMTSSRVATNLDLPLAIVSGELKDVSNKFNATIFDEKPNISSEDYFARLISTLSITIRQSVAFSKQKKESADGLILDFGAELNAIRTNINDLTQNIETFKKNVMENKIKIESDLKNNADLISYSIYIQLFCLLTLIVFSLIKKF